MRASLFGLSLVFILAGALAAVSAPPATAPTTATAPVSTTTAPALTAAAAQAALVAYITEHPAAFASPGRVESAKEVAAAKLPDANDGVITIGRFQVNLVHHSYDLIHEYRQADDSFYELWEWSGEFQIGPANQWILTDPKARKLWGGTTTSPR